MLNALEYIFILSKFPLKVLYSLSPVSSNIVSSGLPFEPIYKSALFLVAYVKLLEASDILVPLKYNCIIEEENWQSIWASLWTVELLAVIVPLIILVVNPSDLWKYKDWLCRYISKGYCTLAIVSTKVDPLSLKPMLDELYSSAETAVLVVLLDKIYLFSELDISDWDPVGEGFI